MTLGEDQPIESERSQRARLILLLKQTCEAQVALTP
jgi:hypothetical protein